MQMQDLLLRGSREAAASLVTRIGRRAGRVRAPVAYGRPPRRPPCVSRCTPSLGCTFCIATMIFHAGAITKLRPASCIDEDVIASFEAALLLVRGAPSRCLTRARMNASSSTTPEAASSPGEAAHGQPRAAVCFERQGTIHCARLTCAAACAPLSSAEGRATARSRAASWPRKGRTA